MSVIEALLKMLCSCHGTVHPLVEVPTGALFCENCGNIPCTAQTVDKCMACGADFRLTTGESFELAEHAVAWEDAEQFRATLLRHAEAEVDPDQAVLDDQDIRGYIGD